VNKLKMIVISFVAVLMTTALNAQNLKSVSFDDYLKAFDNNERRNMKIRIPELLELYKQDKVQIIDIRTSEEYQSYNLDFMTHIPLNKLPERLGELDKNKIIVTVCTNYDRAEMVRIYLTLKGFRSKYLLDGIIGLAEYLRGNKARDFINAIKK